MCANISAVNLKYRTCSGIEIVTCILGNPPKSTIPLIGEDLDGYDDGRRRRSGERQISLGSESDVPLELDLVAEAEKPMDESPTVR